MSSDGDNVDFNAFLFQAIQFDDSEAVQQALKDGANVNAIDSCQNNALINACCISAQIVRILLDAGANTQWTNKDGWTPATTACKYNKLEVVEMLISHDRALVNKGGDTGAPPLMAASAFGHTEICRYLVESGCNVDASDRIGMTALMMAVAMGHLEVVRLLLAAGVNVEANDKSKQTALHFAARNGSVDAMRELILHNANIFAIDKYGGTPFDSDYYDNEEETKNLQIQTFSDRLSQENEGRFTLHELLRTAEYTIANDYTFHPPLHPLRIKIQLGTLAWKHFRTLLLSVDEELLRIRDDSGKLPIHVACQTNAPVEVLAALVDRDAATLHMVDHAGALPLHEYCCGRDDTTDCAGALRYLVERGGVSTLAARNRAGALPLHVLCGAPITTASPPLLAVQYMIQSFPGSLGMRTNSGQYPFMIAASNASLGSLSVVYEIVRANPVLATPR
jgi:ankyrin repeat protein